MYINSTWVCHVSFLDLKVTTESRSDDANKPRPANPCARMGRVSAFVRVFVSVSVSVPVCVCVFVSVSVCLSARLRLNQSLSLINHANRNT